MIHSLKTTPQLTEGKYQTLHKDLSVQSYVLIYTMSRKDNLHLTMTEYPGDPYHNLAGSFLVQGMQAML